MAIMGIDPSKLGLGKIAGGVAGAYFGGPVGAVAGSAAGGVADNTVGKLLAGEGNTDSAQTTTQQTQDTSSSGIDISKLLEIVQSLFGGAASSGTSV